MTRSAFVVAAGVLAGCLMGGPAYATEVTRAGSVEAGVSHDAVFCFHIRMTGPIVGYATATGAVTTGSFGEVGFERWGRPTHYFSGDHRIFTTGNEYSACDGGADVNIRDGEAVYTVSAVGAMGEVVLVLRCSWRSGTVRCV